MNKNMLKRNDRALGAVIVAWLFATIGAIMGVVMWGFDFNQMGFTWIVLFTVILIALLIGWRPLPAPPPGSKKAPTVADHKAAGTGPYARSSSPEPSGGSTAPASPSGAAQAAAAAPPAAASAPTAAPSATTGRKPEALAAPRGGQADDLKQIKGVGPALEKLCNDLGFYHFDQIANWTAEEVAWVDENLEGFKGRVSRDNWVAQARTLAAGGTTEFAERVEKGDVY
jgi:NADH-quinone oxidoreductase subunit E